MAVNTINRLTPNDDAIPVRVFISSDNSLTIRVHMYKEAEDPKTGEVSSHGMHVHMQLLYLLVGVSQLEAVRITSWH